MPPLRKPKLVDCLGVLHVPTLPADIPVSAAKKPAHTPGPWRECGRDGDPAGCVCRMVWSTTADQNVSTGMRQGRAISCVHGEWGDGPDMVYGEIPPAEAAANARLIAAAPDLLAAVKAALAWPDEDEFGNVVGEEYATPAYRAYLQQLRDTIRKAEAGHGD